MSTIDYNSLENALNLAKKALEFYANEGTYISPQGAIKLIELDHGHQARYAVETIDLILNPNHSREEEIKYEQEILAHQQISLDKAIQNMHIQLGDYKKTYNDLLESGMFFEKYPNLSGVWMSDKDEFITNIITNKKY